MEQYIEKLQFMIPNPTTLADAHFMKFCLDMMLASTTATVLLMYAWHTGVLQTIYRGGDMPTTNKWACDAIFFAVAAVFGISFAVAFIANISKFIVRLYLFLNDKTAYLLNLYM
jgi:hypothetical protein